MNNKLLKSSLFQNAGIYTITSLINAAIPFFLLPILTIYMSPKEYGIVSMFTLLITFVSPFTGLSVNGAVVRQYYNKENIRIWEYVFNSVLILISSTAVVSIIFYLFSDLISTLTSFPKQLLWTIIVVSFSQFLTGIVLSLWQVQKKPVAYSIFNISQTLLNAGLSILFIVYIGLNFKGRIYAQMISFTLFSIVSLFVLYKNKWIEFKVNKSYLKDTLSFGIPLIPHALAGSIIAMTDRLFITNMVGLDATGVYTVGYQIGSIINILTMSFNRAYVPWLYERLKKKHK
ncbi:MAG: oligosaccharide flippase family protein [Tissierella sp.]|uniref:oligosaccharide flippase family protein n=1 Tax=Tissierella sp. TaxID=41274 RepID=UPI003F9C0C04